MQRLTAPELRRPPPLRDELRHRTAAKIEVLRLVARGRSAKEIALELGVSRKTAANHTERVYAKIGVSNRALASLYAVRHGLVDPDQTV